MITLRSHALLMLTWTVLLSGAITASAAEPPNWPRWRGPLATGVSPDGNPPIRWSESENVKFKVPIPGNGLASPIVWGDRVFVLTTVPVEPDAYAQSQAAAADVLERKEWPPAVLPVRQRFQVMAFSRYDGSLLWQRTAVEKVPHESHYLDSSWVAASPVTDGKRLFVHFGSNGTYAYDLDGQLLWQVDLGDMTTRRGFGEGSSPALFGNTLVINWDHEGDSFIFALDAATGKEKWRVERPDEVTSWATPLMIDRGIQAQDGSVQVVIPATGRSRSYDLATGKELWSLAGMTVNSIPTPVYDDGIVYLTSGYRGNALQAISLDQAVGELEDSPAVLWQHDRHTPYVPSPLLYGDRIYFLKHFRNILSCLDAKTGKIHYTEQRLPGVKNVWSSPVGAAGRVYVFSREGHAVVLKDGNQFKVLAENDLDEGFDASPAIVGGEMFLRGKKHLYCLAESPKPADTAPSDTAPSDTAPSDTAPSDTAPSDTAPSETATGRR